MQLKNVIPLESSFTELSVYTISDQIFSLRCPPLPFGHHISGKPGLRNKRHFRHTGTLIFLFRARSPSIAEDWYLGLHLKLRKENIKNLELHFPALGIRVRLDTSSEQPRSSSSDAATLTARQELSNAIEDQPFVSKEEMLATSREILQRRPDFAELLHNLEARGLKLHLAWRKGQILEWLTLDRSVDGVKRIWDIYTGAVMKQASQVAHRLEVSVTRCTISSEEHPSLRCPLPFLPLSRAHQVYPEVHYPTTVEIARDQHLIEPPAVEGYVLRLRQRNESQHERMYISTHNGCLFLCKPSKAHHPPFPNVSRQNEPSHKRPGMAIAQWQQDENYRLLQQLIKCKGAVRLRDITKIAVQTTCQKCHQHKNTVADGLAEAMQGFDTSHSHKIVHLEMSDGRVVRFEVSPLSLKYRLAHLGLRFGYSEVRCAIGERTKSLRTTHILHTDMHRSDHGPRRCR